METSFDTMQQRILKYLKITKRNLYHDQAFMFYSLDSPLIAPDEHTQ